MLTRLFRTKIAETADAEQKNIIQQRLHAESIDFKIKVENINQRNTVDAARMGQAVSPKFIFSFWVKRSEEELALRVVRQALHSRSIS